MLSRKSLLLPASLVLTMAGARAAEINLPVETARYAESALPGYALASTLCQTCHSADYTRMQPTNLTATYWKATVVKMQKTFGAPIPDNAVDPIADYLVKTYGAERAAAPKPAPGR